MGKFKPSTKNRRPDKEDLPRQSKPAKKEPSKPQPEEGKPKLTPKELPDQQRIIDVFKNTFSSVLSSSERLNTVLQEIKQALFNREFEKAFGNEEYLDAYAARWSPTRALCYETVLNRCAPNLDGLLPYIFDEKFRGNSCGSITTPVDSSIPRHIKVVSIGGGAAEVAALAAFLRGPSEKETSGELVLLDSAPWKSVVDRLHAGLTTPPPVSQYASAAIKEAATALVPADRISVGFEQKDVLSMSKMELLSVIGPKPVLVTLLFTLNELFTARGLGATTRFLITLTTILPTGSMLLVVDSPGSYSETVVGKEARKWPMQWMADKILLGGKTEDNRVWTKLETDDSTWFRLADGLDYPIPLEDMRYQRHLYRLSDAGNPGTYYWSPSSGNRSTID